MTCQSSLIGGLQAKEKLCLRGDVTGVPRITCEVVLWPPHICRNCIHEHIQRKKRKNKTEELSLLLSFQSSMLGFYPYCVCVCVTGMVCFYVMTVARSANVRPARGHLQ